MPRNPDLPDQMSTDEDPDIQIARHRLRDTWEGYKSSVGYEPPLKLRAWDLDQLGQDAEGWERAAQDPALRSNPEERDNRAREAEALRRLRDRLRAMP
jgi:hypothetical protein